MNTISEETLKELESKLEAEEQGQCWPSTMFDSLSRKHLPALIEAARALNARTEYICAEHLHYYACPECVKDFRTVEKERDQLRELVRDIRVSAEVCTPDQAILAIQSQIKAWKKGTK